MAKDDDGDAPPPRFGAKAKSDTLGTRPRVAPSMTDVTHDERFSAMHRDPRFMAMPKKTSQVAIDARFKGVFDDPNFASGGGAGGRDKRGRKSEGHRDQMAKQRADMAAYYTLDDDEDDDEGLDEKMGKSMDRMRGVGLESSSEDEESDDEDAVASDEEEEGVLPTMLVGEADKDIPITDATRRLAIVNCEWQHIRACDLYAVLRSFVPKGGSLERITVYPSDFGLERMAVENKFGPLGAFKKDDNPRKVAITKKTTANGDESDEGEEVDNEQMRQYERDRLRYYYAIAEFDSVKTAMGVYHECDGIEYERSSFKLDLRYVDDETSFENREVRDIATDIPPDYEAPDFQVKALQHSNVKLSWDDDDPMRRKTFRRKITEDNLKDEDFAAYLASDSEDSDSDSEDEREQTEDAKAAKKAYLAQLLGGDGTIEDDGDDDKDDFFMSDDDDDIEDTAKASTKAFKEKRDKKRFGSKSNDGEMEVTFHAGLEEFGARIKKKKKDGKLGVKETVYEQQERARKEKRDAKRKAAEKAKDGKKNDAEDFEDVDGGDDAPTFEDPFFMDDGGDIDFDAEYDSDDGGKKKPKKSKFDDGDAAPSKTSLKKAKKKAKNGEVDERVQADLELLLMDDKQIMGKSDGIVGAKKVKTTNGEEEPKKKKSRKERLAEKRRARGKAARRAESDDEDGGEPTKLDTGDDRFAALYESHHFSLDPTDPRYKDVENKKLIINERDKRRKTKSETKSKVVSALQSEAKEVGTTELQNMLASLKRKSAKKTT